MRKDQAKIIDPSRRALADGESARCSEPAPRRCPGRGDPIYPGDRIRARDGDHVHEDCV